MRYNLAMKTIYLSNEAHPLLQNYLTQLGYRCETVSASPFLSMGIASHPDLFMCKMGCDPDSPVFMGNPTTPIDPYPNDIPFNAVCTGQYFIHRLDYTDPELLSYAKKMNLAMIDVPQGYTKCNTVVVDKNSLITSDKGISNALAKHPDINCLLIEAGHVKLPGFSSGFLGGASGRVGHRILFHGNLQMHPDFIAIHDFIEARDLKAIWFEEFQLTDIGSIIEACDSMRWEK